jgi:hypothetical protein
MAELVQERLMAIPKMNPIDSFLGSHANPAAAVVLGL